MLKLKPASFAASHAACRFLAAVTLVMTAAAVLYGQLSTASVNGTVLDSSGAIVAEASVVLRNVQTNVERRAETNQTGKYVMLNVPPGEYTLEASKSGFGTKRLQPFTLQVDQTATLDF